MNQNTLNPNLASRELAQTAGSSAGGVHETAGQRNTPVLPPVDIFEDESGFTVLADLPGVSKERLTVRVDGESLVIEGAAEAPVGGEMTLIYGEVLNVTNRQNAGALAPRLAHDPSSDRPLLTEVREQSLPLLPTLGLRVRF